MQQHRAFLFLLALSIFAACTEGGGPSGTGDDGSVAPGTDAGSFRPTGGTIGVECFDMMTCGGDTPNCCFDFPPGTARCEASPSACGRIRLSCDDSNDCAAGAVCCAIQPSGDEITAECMVAAACPLFYWEQCSGQRGLQGGCSNGGFCCIHPGNTGGKCAPTEGQCEPPPTED